MNLEELLHRFRELYGASQLKAGANNYFFLMYDMSKVRAFALSTPSAEHPHSREVLFYPLYLATRFGYLLVDPTSKFAGLITDGIFLREEYSPENGPQLDTDEVRLLIRNNLIECRK